MRTLPRDVADFFVAVDVANGTPERAFDEPTRCGVEKLVARRNEAGRGVERGSLSEELLRDET